MIMAIIADIHRNRIQGTGQALITVMGESPEQEVARRLSRPLVDWRRIMLDALFDEGFIPGSLFYNQYLNCACGCLGGWELGGITGLRFRMLLNPMGVDQFRSIDRTFVHTREAQVPHLIASGEHLVQ